MSSSNTSSTTTTLAPTTATPEVPELTTDGILSIIFILFFVTLNVSGTASSIAALCITAQLFYWGGVITESELWEGFGNGGVINLASLAVLVAALGNVPLVKKVAVLSFWWHKRKSSSPTCKDLGCEFRHCIVPPKCKPSHAYYSSSS